MRVVFFLLIIFWSTLIRAQSLSQLEKKLSETALSDLKKTKSIIDAIFQIDRYNEDATHSLIESYNLNTQHDSVFWFFQHLIEKDSLNPVPYLLRAKYGYGYESTNDSLYIADLSKIIELDRNHQEAHVLLGRQYYTLFHQLASSDSLAQGKPTLLRHYAEKSSELLMKAIQLNATIANQYRYPLLQLAVYLADSATINRFRKEIDTQSLLNDTSYFSADTFADLPTRWDTSFAVDVMDAIDASRFRVDWYSWHLRSLNEPALYGQNSKQTVFRLTWLRTFHHPVAIRIVKERDKYRLSWKVSDGLGGYEPGKLIISRQRLLTREEWVKFRELLAAADFWHQPTSDERLGHDGSRWILEGYDSGKYHTVDRWTPENTSIQKCGAYLISLTAMKIKPSDFY